MVRIHTIISLYIFLPNVFKGQKEKMWLLYEPKLCHQSHQIGVCHKITFEKTKIADDVNDGQCLIKLTQNLGSAKAKNKNFKLASSDRDRAEKFQNRKSPKTNNLQKLKEAFHQKLSKQKFVKTFTRAKNLIYNQNHSHTQKATLKISSCHFLPWDFFADSCSPDSKVKTCYFYTQRWR